MKTDNLGELIISIFREEWMDEEPECNKTTTNGARRNERCKVNKQIKNKDLDWKYVEGMINFCKSSV
jgi:hypothetical protein